MQCSLLHQSAWIVCCNVHCHVQGGEAPRGEGGDRWSRPAPAAAPAAAAAGDRSEERPSGAWRPRRGTGEAPGRCYCCICLTCSQLYIASLPFRPAAVTSIHSSPGCPHFHAVTVVTALCCLGIMSGIMPSRAGLMMAQCWRALVSCAWQHD